MERRFLAPVSLLLKGDTGSRTNPAGDGDRDRHGAPSPGSDVREVLTKLFDDDAGVFEVRTVTAWYVVDLDARWVHRLPASVAPGETMAATAIVFHFQTDGNWLPLVELHECELGQRMRATVRIDDLDQPLRSTLVRSIRPYLGPRTPMT